MIKSAPVNYEEPTNDSKVLSAPSKKDIAKLQAKYPDVVVSINVNDGQMLSEIKVEDSYTYCIAELYLGAESEEALLNKIEDCKSMLPFKLSTKEKTFV